MRLANIATVLVHGRNELHLKFNNDADLRAAYDEITQHMEGAEPGQITEAFQSFMVREFGTLHPTADFNMGQLSRAFGAGAALAGQQSERPAPVGHAEDCGEATLQWKFEQFIDFATGGKLSKSTWALETLKAAVTEYVNETVQACAKDGVVTVCPECDIADCHHIRARGKK